MARSDARSKAVARGCTKLGSLRAFPYGVLQRRGRTLRGQGRCDMGIRKLIGIISAAASAAGIVAYAEYRRDMRAIRSANESGGTIAATKAGPIEYAEQGEGEPLLVVHGAGGGYDQGLLLARDLGDGFRVIAPSRFGYLG